MINNEYIVAVVIVIGLLCYFRTKIEAFTESDPIVMYIIDVIKNNVAGGLGLGDYLQKMLSRPDSKLQLETRDAYYYFVSLQKMNELTPQAVQRYMNTKT